jgi:flagellar protein FliO/FliZ
MSNGPSYAPMFAALLLVLALVPVALWLLKRLGAGRAGEVAGLKIVAQLALGARERLVVVEAGDRWLLLGVTASSINRVGTLPKGTVSDAGAGAAPFAALLQAARGKHDAR